MAKKKAIKSNLVMDAKIVDLKRHDEGIGIAFRDKMRIQPFIIYFDVIDEDLEIGDQVTVTVSKKLEV